MEEWEKKKKTIALATTRIGAPALLNVRDSGREYMVCEKRAKIRK